MSGPGFARLLGIGAAVVVIDLVTKAMARAMLEPSSPVKLVGDMVRLTLVFNSGTAFGLFPGNRLPFIVFSIIAIGVILVMYARLRHRTTAQVVAMGLLLGGAIGNLHDRIRFGDVTDFLQIGVAGHYWPVFNAADSAITIGVCMLVLTLMRAPIEDEESAAITGDAAGEASPVERKPLEHPDA